MCRWGELVVDDTNRGYCGAMITRIEIDGFKTFENFQLDLRPFTAVVGPNASGKSNLFDALRFISLLAQTDIRSAMQELRGEPEELFRRTRLGTTKKMTFAVEVLLDSSGIDAFFTTYDIKSQRLRYEVSLALKDDGYSYGISVIHESCVAITKKDDRARYLRRHHVGYSYRKNPFIGMSESDANGSRAIEIRQDGPAESGTSKRGRPLRLPASGASRTALSTINTAEFPHLYALRDLLSTMRFLEINPSAARRPSDRFESKILRPDASNLAAVLAHLREETSAEDRPDGVISDISFDLSSLIPTVKSVNVFSDKSTKDYSFGVSTTDSLNFSSRVISDGTLRLLALLAILDDPDRSGILCFEEPENGVHEGRIPALVHLLRESSEIEDESGPFFQVLINTHSPAVLNALDDDEIVAADIVYDLDPSTRSKSNRTRMRTGVRDGELELDPERHLTRHEIDRLLKKHAGEA